MSCQQHISWRRFLASLTEAKVWHSGWLWKLYLVTDEVPLLLIIILPEETCFIWGQVHRVLKNKRVLSHQNTQEVIYSSMYPWQRPCRDICARFLSVTAVSCLTRETLQPMTSRPVLTYMLFEIIFLFSRQANLCLMTECDFKLIFLLNFTFQTIFLYFLKETAFAKLTGTIVSDCRCVAVLGSC